MPPDSAPSPYSGRRATEAPFTASTSNARTRPYSASVVQASRCRPSRSFCGAGIAVEGRLSGNVLVHDVHGICGFGVEAVGFQVLDKQLAVGNPGFMGMPPSSFDIIL